MVRIVIFAVLLWTIVSAKAAQEAVIHSEGRENAEALARAKAPYIRKARATYPKAKQRFLAGLPAGDTFVVRRVLSDPGKHGYEGVYVEVDSIRDGKIHGRIATEVTVVKSFRQGQRISFPEAELEDWSIFHPDGSAEGDVVAKFLKRAQSKYSNDLALTWRDVAKIKSVCRQMIGTPFENANLWMELAPFILFETDLYQPVTHCAGEFCSGGLRLRDDSQLLYTFLHVPPKGRKTDSGDITPDRGRKGNNRFVGVALIQHGKITFSQGKLDQQTADGYLRSRDTRKNRND